LNPEELAAGQKLMYFAVYSENSGGFTSAGADDLFGTLDRRVREGISGKELPMWVTGR
jgi:hypothetical protein